MLKWTAATLAGVPIVMAQSVAECLAGIFRTILVPVALVLTAVAVIIAPGSEAAYGAVQNAVLVAAAWIAAEGAQMASAMALRWLDAQRIAP